MTFAKVSTAKTFMVGPILDADGVAVTSAKTATAVMKVTKNGTVDAADAQDTMTHDHTGHYKYVSDGGDFDTLGEVEFSLNDGTDAMAPVKFQVVPAVVYNALVGGTDYLQTDTVQVNGVAVSGSGTINANLVSIGDDIIAADNLKSYCDGTTPIPANTTQFAGQTITCAAGVTIYPAVGLTATARTNVEIVYATDFTTNYNTTQDMWQVDVAKWKNDTVPATSIAGVPEVDVTYLNGVAATGTGTIDANLVSCTADAISAAGVSDAAVTKIQAGITIGTDPLLTTLSNDWANGGRLDLILDIAAASTGVTTVNITTETTIIESE